ncbi:MAG TPA: class I adenylate-forming enzyme family protein [Actinocrinis sp.]|uniref:class I adenylate-forming enzyme family protein n=1 Tax=Actinocrinis sp. TaxID=1920516 RepID=UPI002DDD1995|nr:class I adenylate-forming enzyme family protein [Actinocrinis sp.]HEV2346642.1 class I adenylate-forming enzyme family protein [Actinocrinis sp.]
MKGFTRQGLYLGAMAQQAAASHGSTLLTLDHDLDVLPEAGRRLTVAELAYHVDDLAGRLSAAGVRSREHVAIYKTANFDASMLTMAVSRIGAVPVTLSPALNGTTVGTLLGRLNQPHLITDAAKLAVLADVPLKNLTRTVLSATEPAPGVVALPELAGSPRPVPVFLDVDEAALITHTSGTTGVPKLVVHTPRTMRTRLRPQLFLLGLMRKKESVAIAIPFVHSRTFAALALCLIKALPMQLVKESDPKLVAEFFLKHRPGLIEALPNLLVEWEALADDPRRPFASVKYFSSTFDAIHPRTISRLIDSSARRGALFFQIYGQSEVGGAVGRPYFRRSAHRTDGRCVGWALPGSARTRVTSRDGRPPSRQNPGYIEVSWAGIAKTYFGQQELFEAGMHDGWRRTGDVGYRTRTGCLHMLDREVDMIAGVGSNLEIEDVMMAKLTELMELIVVTGPDGEPIPVVCTLEDRRLDPARWRAAAAAFPQLADPVQLPWAEVPRTATMKVQRVELARRLAERAAAAE